MGSGAASGGTPPAPYFFLSYARTPKWDPNSKSDPNLLAEKLYRDLCGHILEFVEDAEGPVGYMDRENRPGDRWPAELAQALATCRVFVPLYSPRYFSRKNCGMEWFAFSRRLVKHKARLGLPAADAIVPALWTPVARERMPQVARSIQYDHAGQPSRYLSDGFYGLIKLDRYRRDYQDAVYHLAKRIVEVAQLTQIGPDEPADYQSLESAFELGTEHHHMQIAVLAPSISTLPNGREISYYGKTARAWGPYRPEYPQPLAESAAELTTCFGCEPAVLAFDRQSPYWAADGRPVPPGVCLVDPWATLSPAHEEQLRRLNEVRASWFSVLVPWNSGDTEMATAEPELRQRLSESLRRKLDDVPYRCRVAASGIETFEDFSDVLPRMAMIMLKRFRGDPEVPAYPPPGDRIERGRIRPVEDEGRPDAEGNDGGTDDGGANGDHGGADE